jgi:predicted RNA-binding protein with PUA-like domain
VPQAKQFWLMKTEPTSFSIDDLRSAPKQTTCWDGVRNYQARNFMRAMRMGDRVLFYHSNAEPALNGMELLRKGSRLSVQPVSAEHFAVVLQLAKKPGGAAKAGNKRTARS